jgi:UDP-N-acetyl-2-amino-2-deoxyglucuronate dehydrogenase
MRKLNARLKDEIPFFSSADEMLMTGPACDVVCICSPNGLHFEHAMLALRSNKHVVIEKPMALTKTDCENIIMQAKNVQREIFCVMQNRYSPPSIWIKGIIGSKDIR